MSDNISDKVINLEWGVKGLKKFKPVSDVIIIIDVLSFSTCVDIVLNKSAFIYPYKYMDDTTILYSMQVGAELASTQRSKNNYSLSPGSLLNIKSGSKLVLPSPNGSELSFLSGSAGIITLTACLRNCRAVAEYAMELGKNITLIPAGEKWEDGSIRFAIEDILGAGAVISFLDGNFSAEALFAKDLYNTLKSDVCGILSECVSGKELIEKEFETDVRLACETNVSDSIPVFNVNRFENARNHEFIYT